MFALRIKNDHDAVNQKLIYINRCASQGVVKLINRSFQNAAVRPVAAWA